MKKKAITLFLTMAVAISAMGCGRGNDNKNNTGIVDNTENKGAGNVGTESVMENTETGTENDFNQLQLGNALELPEGFEGAEGETDAHGDLEKLIAKHLNIGEENYKSIRYYYNYVDLNDDGRNEILALVLGQEVAGIDGNLLLWLDEPEDEKITSHSIRQVFRQVGAPIYISNHMTEGYRDLIITEHEDVYGENGPSDGEEVNADNAGRTIDGEETSMEKTAGLDETTGTNGAQLLTVEQTYLLLVWKGDKYQELEEGTALSSLDGYEGTAVLTNNIESNIANDNYHFLGEGAQK